MPKETRHRNRIELLRGAPDPLALQTLRWGPRHGDGVSRALSPRGQGGEA